MSIALALTSCPGTEPEPTATVPSPPGATRGGVLQVSLAGDVDSLDPHRAASPASWFFARALHRGLLAFPSEGDEPVPDLATAAPRVDARGTRFTFTLRENVPFDERDLGATDVAASLARVVRADAGVARFLHVIRGARAVALRRASLLSGVTIPDERTVVIRLTRRAPDLPWILAHPQIAILPAGTPAAGDVAPDRIRGLGPYRLKTYTPERRIVLERNPIWRDDPVRGAWLDGIAAGIGVRARAALGSVARGETHLVLDPGPPDLEPLAGASGVRVLRGEPTCVRYLFLNTRVPPFTDRTARVAVARAVRREALPGVPDDALPATGLLPPSVVGHRDTLALPEGGAGRQISARLVIADSPRDRAEARALRTTLARAGIEITVSPVDPAHLYPLHYADPAARVPMGIATWCADWPGLAGRNVLGSIADPRAVRAAAPNPIFSHLRAPAVAAAIRNAERAERAQSAARWAAAARSAERTGALIPLTYPLEMVVLAEEVGGYTGATMWPRGDPGALWLGATTRRSAGPAG